MIVVNSIVALSVLMTMIPPGLGSHDLPPPPLPQAWNMRALVFGFIGIANVIFSVALVRWKKWGFFGWVGTSILLVVSNLIFMHAHRAHLSLARAPLPLLYVVILYVLFQTGNEKRGWTQLE
ncbi:MAG: hypothetical protein ACLPHP_05310 [Candidatus Sulfotelmatobacter sp.]